MTVALRPPCERRKKMISLRPPSIDVASAQEVLHIVQRIKHPDARVWALVSCLIMTSRQRRRGLPWSSPQLSIPARLRLIALPRPR